MRTLGTRMRLSALGLFLLGAGLLFASVLNAAANAALGNPVSGGFFYELLAFGSTGTVAMITGMLLYVYRLRKTRAG